MRRPTRAIHNEAGMVSVAVPSIMAAMGKFAHVGDGAIRAPANPPTVATITVVV